MNQGLIPRRYAKALLEFAGERQDDRRLYDIMKTLVASFDANPDMGHVVANPFVPAKDKRELLFTAAGVSRDDKVLDDIFALLEHNNRIGCVREIALAYLRLFRKANNIFKVEVVSAAPLSEEEDRRLRSIIEAHLNGAHMEYSAKIDPSLIGGFVVTIDSERLDASIKNELKQLRLTLIGK